MVTGKPRASKQRDRILDVLRGNRIHAGAQWVYEQLRPEYPHLSLGNVYRNLNILVDLGLVNRLPLGSGSDVYEAVKEPHYHFICDRCGGIFDVEIPEELQNGVSRRIEENHGHLVVSRSVEFHGVCRECRRREG